MFCFLIAISLKQNGLVIFAYGLFGFFLCRFPDTIQPTFLQITSDFLYYNTFVQCLFFSYKKSDGTIGIISGCFSRSTYGTGTKCRVSRRERACPYVRK